MKIKVAKIRVERISLSHDRPVLITDFHTVDYFKTRYYEQNKITFSVTTMLNYSYPAISTGTLTIQNGTASISYGGGNTQAADDGHMGRTASISVTSIEKI